MGRANCRAMNQAPINPEREERQGDAGEHAAHPLDLVSLLVLQLRADAGESLLHLGAAHPDLQAAAALASIAAFA